MGPARLEDVSATPTLPPRWDSIYNFGGSADTLAILHWVRLPFFAWKHPKIFHFYVSRDHTVTLYSWRYRYTLSENQDTDGEFATERRRHCLTGVLCLAVTLLVRPFLQRCAEGSPLGAEVCRLGCPCGLRAAPLGPPGQLITGKTAEILENPPWFRIHLRDEVSLMSRTIHRSERKAPMLCDSCRASTPFFIGMSLI